MKVAVVSTGVLPQPAVKGGAVETLIDMIINYNEKIADCDLTVFTVSDSVAQEKASKYKNTKMVYIKRNNILDRLVNKKRFPMRWIIKIFQYKVAKYLKSQKYDVVILENEFDCINKIKKSCSNAKLILHLHNDYINSSIDKIENKIDKIDEYYTISDYLRNRVYEVSQEAKIKTIYNGVNVSKFDREKIDNHKLEKLRKNLDIKEKDLVIAFAGRLIAEKGVKELLTAFSMIKSEQIKLMIIGSSFFSQSNETPYIRELKAIAEKDKRIIFTGYVKYDEMPLYYALADIGCVPSTWEEPFGLTVIEQMAMGLPVVVSDAGAIPEIVSEKSAIVVKRDDKYIESLNKALKELISNPSLRVNMGMFAKKQARVFSEEYFAENFFNTLME